ncbi:MAG: hypothetical protein KAQ98_11625 [Bacteriovoracaceae bacterium]|nr:hypothetical protein [Bacteriovoracaceae bacterium]
MGVKYLFTFMLLILTVGRALAAIGFRDAVFPEFAISGRATAMGSAYICKVDDPASVFYNPAGLGTVRKTHFHFSNFHLETNRDWMKLATTGKLWDAMDGFFDGLELEGLRKLLLNDRGRVPHLRIQAMPNFTTRYMSIGYLYSRQTRATIGGAGNSKFEYAKREDHGPYAALNLSLFGGIFKFGGSAIILQRKENIGEADANVSFEDTPDRKGTAVIVTGGSRLTLPVTFLPTFSLVVRNMTATTFSGRAAGPPEKIPQTMDLGFSITPQIGKIIRVHFETNYKDIGNRYSDVSTVRKILFGMEIDFARAFFIRGGYGDGFGTAGLGIKAQGFEFDLSTYAIDTTTVNYRGKEDRRFSMTLSWGF